MTNQPTPRRLPRWTTEVEEGAWIADRLHPLGADVGSVVPDCFPAHARILHPLWSVDNGRRRRVRWSDLANGSAIGPATRPEDLPVTRGIAASAPGTLDPEDLTTLIDILREHTRTPERCWFGIWDGYGWIGEEGATSTLDATGGAHPSWTTDRTHLPAAGSVFQAGRSSCTKAR